MKMSGKVSAAELAKMMDDVIFSHLCPVSIWLWIRSYLFALAFSLPYIWANLLVFVHFTMIDMIHLSFFSLYSSDSNFTE